MIRPEKGNDGAADIGRVGADRYWPDRGQRTTDREQRTVGGGQIYRKQPVALCRIEELISFMDFMESKKYTIYIAIYRLIV